MARAPATKSVRSAVGVLAYASRRDCDPARLGAARRDWRAARLGQDLREAVDADPPLTAEQRLELAMILMGDAVRPTAG